MSHEPVLTTPVALRPFLRSDPFPHCVLPLDEGFYSYCLSRWPTSAGSPGARTNAPVEDAGIRRPLAAAARAAAEVFEPALRQSYPSWSPGATSVRVLWSSQKASDRAFNARDWHLDLGRKVVVGLWYFQAPDDDAGGDLLLRSSADVEPHRIAYARNQLVLFPNLPCAWHAVSERRASTEDRRFINILLEQDEPMHDYRRNDAGQDVVRPVQNYFSRLRRHGGLRTAQEALPTCR